MCHDQLFICDVTHSYETGDDSQQVRGARSVLCVTRPIHVWHDLFTFNVTNSYETHDDSLQVGGALALLHAP